MATAALLDATLEGMVVAMIGAMFLRRQRQRKRKHRWWVHSILQRRQQYGTYHHLIAELELDSEKFHTYFRMSKDQFGSLLGKLEEQLSKHCLSREVICPKQRLAVCLR